MRGAAGTDSGAIMMITRIGRSGLVGLLALIAGAALATSSETEVTNAWTAAGGESNGEAPLYMTVTNHGGTPDALMRVRCPVAWASEPRTTDHGEGGLSSRAVKSIAIPPDTTVILGPGSFHVALLQLKERLREGDTFTCAVTFNDGPKDVPVRVSGAARTSSDNK
jgi:periplasmic copper chaperone A